MSVAGRPSGAVARVLVGPAWRAAPAMLVWAFTATTVAAVASATFPLGFHLMVDGALAHDRERVVAGACLVAVLFTTAWTLSTMAAARDSALTDRVGSYLMARIATLVNAVPAVEHLERPDLLSEIDQLREGRRTLAGAARQLLGGWRVIIRSAAIIVLLATVYPPVMVVPLVGLAPMLADRRASRVQKVSDDALAADRRLADQLFGLATTADTARELRTYGVTGALAARHAAIAERVR
ncbi:hypothetical protein, partial [Actinoallomurus acaciae]